MKKMLLGMDIELFAIALVLCAHRMENIALFIAVVGIGFVIADIKSNFLKSVHTNSTITKGVKV